MKNTTMKTFFKNHGLKIVWNGLMVTQFLYWAHVNSKPGMLVAFLGVMIVGYLAATEYDKMVEEFNSKLKKEPNDDRELFRPNGRPTMRGAKLSDAVLIVLCNEFNILSISDLQYRLFKSGREVTQPELRLIMDFLKKEGMITYVLAGQEN